MSLITLLRNRSGVYRLPRLYVGHQACPAVVPDVRMAIDPRVISRTLRTSFHPGFFRVLDHAPSRLMPLFKSLRITGFCVAPGDWTPNMLRLEEHPTWTYASHALAYSRTGDEAHVEAAWSFGRSAREGHAASLGRFRRIDEFVKVSTADWTIDEARQYLTRVAGLSRIIEETQAIPGSRMLGGESGRVDEDIGIAIGRNGEILHFRKGHHRIMLARQMNLPSLRVAVNIVHSKWLQNALGLGPRGIAGLIGSEGSEISERIRDAIERHVGQTIKQTAGIASPSLARDNR